MAVDVARRLDVLVTEALHQLPRMRTGCDHERGARVAQVVFSKVAGHPALPSRGANHEPLQLVASQRTAVVADEDQFVARKWMARRRDALRKVCGQNFAQ